MCIKSGCGFGAIGGRLPEHLPVHMADGSPHFRQNIRRSFPIMGECLDSSRNVFCALHSRQSTCVCTKYFLMTQRAHECSSGQPSIRRSRFRCLCAHALRIMRKLPALESVFQYLFLAVSAAVHKQHTLYAVVDVQPRRKHSIQLLAHDYRYNVR